MDLVLTVFLVLASIWSFSVVAVLIVYHIDYFSQNDFRKSLAIILFPLFPIFGIIGLIQESKKIQKE